MILWLAGAALAGQIQVISPDGPLRPGTPAVVHVAAADDLGGPAPVAPTVTSADGRVRPIGPIEPGVYAYAVVPPESGSLSLLVDAYGEKHGVALPIEPTPPSRLEIPSRIDAMAGDPLVRLRVTGADLPPPEALQVVVGEGSVVGVEAVDGALEIRLSMPESPYPRFVPVGVRDTRRDERPAWAAFRLRTRVTLNLQTEPGASLVVSVGRRSYGPFLADATGMVRPVIEQWPGELSATAVLTDDLGNETRTTLALTGSAEASLVSLRTGEIVAGRPLPEIWLYGLHSDGRTWEGAPPFCQTPGAAALPVQGLGGGEWRVPLPELPSLQDLRVRCVLGGVAEVVERVAVGDEVPQRLELRVWPEELSTDFPVAEVQAVLENARGERVPTDGVRVYALTGAVARDEGPAGLVWRGEYDGRASVPGGGDTLSARYDLPAGEGPVAFLGVAHGAVGRLGTVKVFARASDASGRPLPGVSVALDAGAEPATAVTGSDGWASVEVVAPPGLGALVLTARSGDRTARGLAPRGAPARGGPGSPDLFVEKKVPITTGRVAEIDVKVDPDILYTGPRSVARIEVRIKDRTGALVSEPPDALQLSAGTCGEWVGTGDGGWVCTYTPPPGDVARVVDVAVRSESATTLARVQLEPRPIDRSALFAVGFVSNFGVIASPLITADVDYRLPVWGRKMMLRAGVGYYGASVKVDTGVGTPADLRATIFPLTVGVVARGDFRGDAVWGGLGGVVAPYIGEARFGTESVRELSVYPPGLAMIAGLGRRLGSGEVFTEIRGTVIVSPGGDFALTGPVGGVGAVVGYRVIY
jgi:hypothetical protein